MESLTPSPVEALRIAVRHFDSEANKFLHAAKGDQSSPAMDAAARYRTVADRLEDLLRTLPAVRLVRRAAVESNDFRTQWTAFADCLEGKR